MRLRPLATYLMGLTWRQHHLLLQALVALVGFELLLRLFHFERLTRWLRLRSIETPFEADADMDRQAREIGWAIDAVANRAPWLVKCLTRALAAGLLGRWHALPTTLYLGVVRSDQGELQAHAWSRCGEHIITGKAQRAGFATIAHFSDW